MEKSVTSLLAAAPMEGLTTWVWRAAHRRAFGGVDRYYLPFVTPTREPKFTERQLKDIEPALAHLDEAVPQLLTNRAEDFIWAAKTLSEMGFKEVNLNLGCPSGTVVAKGKGAGFLRSLNSLEAFLESIFSVEQAADISVKTRLGWASEEEFEEVARLLSKFPFSLVIVHPRLKCDQYKGRPRWQALERHMNLLGSNLGINGDIVHVEDFGQLSERFSSAKLVMCGRPLMADPALFRKIKGGPVATREEIFEFSATIFDDYTRAFNSRRNAMMRMKEYWFYQLSLFEDNAKLRKQLFKTKTAEAFASVLKQVESELPLRKQASYEWFKSA